MAPTELVIDQGVVAGNVYDKYQATNPIARRLMRGFLEAFDACVQHAQATDIHEVGCGEGHLLTRMAQTGTQLRGSDISPRIIEIAQRTLQEADLNGPSVDLQVADVCELTSPADRAELVVCCEVLEHVPDPSRALQVLHTLAQPWLLASVPREPLWRGLNMCRGKYLGAFGNTPGHLNHWSRRGFVRFLEAGGLLPVLVRSPLPWTMVLCRRSSRGG